MAEAPRVDEITPKETGSSPGVSMFGRKETETWVLLVLDVCRRE